MVADPKGKPCLRQIARGAIAQAGKVIKPVKPMRGNLCGVLPWGVTCQANQSVRACVIARQNLLPPQWIGQGKRRGLPNDTKGLGAEQPSQIRDAEPQMNTARSLMRLRNG
jgi:hypothetical protein